MKKFGFLITLMCVFALCSCLLFAQSNENRVSVNIVQVRDIFPDAFSLEYDTHVDGVIEVHDERGNFIGRVVNSQPESDQFIGYAGTVPVLIGFTVDNVVAGITLLNNRETPGYLFRLGGRDFFNSWNGMTSDEAALHPVDAVTGATRTSTAVIESVRAKLGVIAQSN
jgi:Na+-translocating ferredoxin:NAD+ oxidoreductase RnfG subunit